MQYISIVNILSRLFSVGLIFILVKTPNDLFLYCFLYSISPVISGILGIIFAKKAFNIKLVLVGWKEIAEEMKSGWYVFTTQLSSKIFGAVGITFLGIFASNTEVGIYSAIQKIPNIIILGWTPISQVLYPISSKYMQISFIEGLQFINKVKKKIFPLFIAVATLIIIFSKIIVRIAFGAEYEIFYYWIIPLLLWLIISINNNFLGIQILLGSGHDKEYSKCFQAGVICTILFNLILIYLFKGNGASIAPLLSESVLGMLLHCEVNKIKADVFVR